MAFTINRSSAISIVRATSRVSCTKRFDLTKVECISNIGHRTNKSPLARRCDLAAARVESPVRIAYLAESCYAPALWILCRIAEEVEEEGLGESIELGEGVAALGPQRLGLIQDRRNPPLLRQRREGNCEFCKSWLRLSAIVPP